MSDGDGIKTVTKGPRACATCARAKSRCIPGPVPDICERCHRLKKSCSSQTPAPPRKRKEPRPNRVAELERRLEDLRTRLQPVVDAQQQDGGHRSDEDQDQRQDGNQHKRRERQQPTPPGDHPMSPVQRGPRVGPLAHLFPMPGSEMRLQSSASTQEQLNAFFSSPGWIANGPGGSGRKAEINDRGDSTSLSPSSSQQRRDSARSPSVATSTEALSPPPPACSHTHTHTTDAPMQPTADLIWPDQVEAAALLHIYQTNCARLFPFIVIPTEMTADQLRERKPFLWKGVMMAACLTDGDQQVAMGDQLLREVAAACLMEPRKGVDLLQSIQLLLAWFHYNLNSFQTTNLLFLARSICVSLGFHETTSGYGPAATAAMERLVNPLCTALEEMRAFAGTYYLVTMVFTTNKKPDALMNTSYLDTCCQVLQSRMEYPSDELLVHLVKIQQLSQAISLSLAFRSSGNSNSNNGAASPYGGSGGGGMELPLNIVVRSFQQQLSALEQGLPASVREDAAIMNHFHIAHILLCEISLHDNSSLAPTDRLELLWACLAACRAFMANRFKGLANPPLAGEDEDAIAALPEMRNGNKSSPMRFCCLSSFDFIYAFTTSLRLMMLQAPGWDREVVRSQIDLVDAIDNQRIEVEKVIACRNSKRRGSAPPPGSPPQQQQSDVPMTGQTTTTTQPTSTAGVPKRTNQFEKLLQRLIILRSVLDTNATDDMRRMLFHKCFTSIGTLGDITTGTLGRQASADCPVAQALAAQGQAENSTSGDTAATATATATAFGGNSIIVGNNNGGGGITSADNHNIANNSNFNVQMQDYFLPEGDFIDPWAQIFNVNDEEWNPFNFNWGRGLAGQV